jgi:hypothetical protein
MHLAYDLFGCNTPILALAKYVYLNKHDLKLKNEAGFYAGGHYTL